MKRKRKALDLTQAELADQVGCSEAAIRKIEAEERHPSAQIVGLLADIFDIPESERTLFLRFARGDWKSAPTIPTLEDSGMHWVMSGAWLKPCMPSGWLTTGKVITGRLMR
ncbi:MAG TPA: helix-turn-helix transcriptional regulator [Anaerolineaceae bacterium]|nr:helix-turn-helix transcriptional regulator [Anaerolineaceae bacterium]